MRYQEVVPGRFLSRPNRFIAYVETEEGVQTVHVKNTGRCRELLVPGCRVWCQDCGNPNRKTQYDLICVEKGPRLINMDSQAPNAAAKEWLLSGGLGEIENLPAADNFADVCISNCVINLSPSKPRVYREIFRVLKPGGRISICDIVIHKEIPQSMKDDPEMHSC